MGSQPVIRPEPPAAGACAGVDSAAEHAVQHAPASTSGAATLQPKHRVACDDPRPWGQHA